MNKEENIFYYVSKDANGTPARKIPVGHFTIEENIQLEPEELKPITQKDLDTFKEEIRQMLTAQTSTSTPKTSTTKSSTSTKKD